MRDVSRARHHEDPKTGRRHLLTLDDPPSTTMEWIFAQAQQLKRARQSGAAGTRLLAGRQRRSGFYASHVNLSAGNVEGLAHDTLPAVSVQFHPDASPGPQDNHDLFDRFGESIERRGAAQLAG